MTSLSSYCPTGLNCYTVQYEGYITYHAAYRDGNGSTTISIWDDISVPTDRKVMEIIHMAFKIFSCRWSKYLQKTITGIVTIVTISTSNSKHIHEVYSHSIFVISLRVTSLIRVAVSDNYSHQSKYCFMNVPAAYFIIFFTILFSLIQAK